MEWSKNHSARASSSSHARRLSNPFTLEPKPSPNAIHASPLLPPLPLPPPPPPFAIERNVHRAYTQISLKSSAHEQAAQQQQCSGDEMVRIKDRYTNMQ